MNRLATKLLTGFIFVALLATAACDAANTFPRNGKPGPTPVPVSGFSNETYAAALRSASIKLRGKLPATEDSLAVLADGSTAYNALIEEYLDPDVNPDLVDQIKGYYRALFKMAGNVNGTNYNLPSNLGAYLFVNDLPVSELVTAEYCVGNDLTVFDEPTTVAECEGAPAGERAGVIGMKPFLKMFGQTDTVNMRRVSVVHQIFACEIYPDTLDESRLNRTNAPESTWPMNENDSPDETADDFPDPALGDVADDPADPPRVSKKYQSKLKGDSGAQCVQCHGHLNQRRPVFTPYNPDGIYDEERSLGNNVADPENTVESPADNGGQDYCGLLGDTDNSGDPDDDDIDANSAGCQNDGKGPGVYFGRTLNSLRDYGLAITDRELTGGRFYTCMTTRHYDFALGKSQGEVSMQAANGSSPAGVAPDILEKYMAVYESSNWSTRDLLLAVFKGPEFLAANQ